MKRKTEKVLKEEDKLYEFGLNIVIGDRGVLDILDALSFMTRTDNFNKKKEVFSEYARYFLKGVLENVAEKNDTTKKDIIGKAMGAQNSSPKNKIDDMGRPNTIQMRSPVASRYLYALRLKYAAQREEALAVLDTYSNSAVGIGEHSDLLTEFDSWVSKLADADDKLGALDKFFDAPE